MNNSAAQSWAAADHLNMDTTTDNFAGAEFIDFDNLDLDFNMDGYNSQGPASTGSQLADLTDSLNVHHLQSQFPPQLAPDYHNGPNGAQKAQNVNPHPLSQSTNNFFDYGMSQHSAPAYSQPQDQLYRSHQGVPPTPNSTELHGDPNRYLQQVESHQALFDQRYHMRKDDTVCRPWRNHVDPLRLTLYRHLPHSYRPQSRPMIRAFRFPTSPWLARTSAL
jgi:hypothetical protein